MTPWAIAAPHWAYKSTLTDIYVGMYEGGPKKWNL